MDVIKMEATIDATIDENNILIVELLVGRFIILCFLFLSLYFFLYFNLLTHDDFSWDGTNLNWDDF